MRADPPPLPRAIERLLADAAGDEAFREHLLRDRLGAVAARGYVLGAAERALLAAAPEEQLRALLARLPRRAPVPRDWERVLVTGIRPDGPERVRGSRPSRSLLAAAAVAAVAAGSAALLCADDEPPPRAAQGAVAASADAGAGDGGQDAPPR